MVRGLLRAACRTREIAWLSAAPVSRLVLLSPKGAKAL